MPFKFTGTLEKVQIKLGPNELTPQQRGELEQLKRDWTVFNEHCTHALTRHVGQLAVKDFRHFRCGRK